MSANIEEEARAERRYRHYLGGFFRYIAATVLLLMLALLLDAPSDLWLRVIAIAASILTLAVALYLFWKYRVLKKRFAELHAPRDTAGQGPPRP